MPLYGLKTDWLNTRQRISDIYAKTKKFFRGGRINGGFWEILSKNGRKLYDFTLREM